MTNFEKVKEFMSTFGQEVRNFPSTRIELSTQKLRYDLIKEELDELKEAMVESDIVEIADAIADILYVTYGAAAAYGINVDMVFDEVHDSNMSKLDEDGNPIYNDDGKVMKGPGYFEPRIATILTRQRRNL